MNNSSTSNSDFSRFIQRMIFYIGVLIVATAIVFALPLSRSYYFEIPRNSDYSKLSWVNDTLSKVNRLDDSYVFIGSSICMNGVNDSLLNAMDTTTSQYINLGVTHTCYAICDALIRYMVHDKQLHPKKVFLCFKGDAMARNIHNMYPLAATRSDILRSGLDGNTLILPTYLKRVAWNTHALSSVFKFDDSDPKLAFHSDYGFKPQIPIPTEQVEKSYTRLRGGSEMNFKAIEAEANGTAMGMKTKLLLLKSDILENIRFQRYEFEKSARMLEEAGIPFDIILYPNLVSARMGKPHLMADYIERTFTSIDFNKHHVIAVDDTCFTNAAYYVDMNHLNPSGAEKLTEFLYRTIHE